MPNEGFCFDRIPDQMNGFFGSNNICDFTLFKAPNFYYIESKASYNDNMPFNMLTDYQYDHMREKAHIAGVKSYAIFLFASYRRAFIFDILDIEKSIAEGVKSVNIKKVDRWKIPYTEIPTVQSRKQLLDYDKDFAKKFF